MIPIERCLICHRKLKDPISQKRKIGPTCWKRVQKVVNEERKKKAARRSKKAEMIQGQITMWEAENEYNNEKPTRID